MKDGELSRNCQATNGFWYHESQTSRGHVYKLQSIQGLKIIIHNSVIFRVIVIIYSFDLSSHFYFIFHLISLFTSHDQIIYHFYYFFLYIFSISHFPHSHTPKIGVCSPFSLFLRVMIYGRIYHKHSFNTV